MNWMMSVNISTGLNVIKYIKTLSLQQDKWEPDVGNTFLWTTRLVQMNVLYTDSLVHYEASLLLGFFGS